MSALAGRNVLMVIAAKDFRDEEYEAPRKILEGQGATVTVASSSLDPARGMLGLVVRPQILVAAARADDCDAVIFVGGSGADAYWDSRPAHDLARSVVAAGKVVGAICIAPVTLANAGLLVGKRATVWPDCAPQLRRRGARIQDAPVVRDGRIVTANGPEAADAFGKEIVDAMTRG
jgi:protease I